MYVISKDSSARSFTGGKFSSATRWRKTTYKRRFRRAINQELNSMLSESLGYLYPMESIGEFEYSPPRNYKL